MRLRRGDEPQVTLGYVTSAHPASDVAGLCDGLRDVAARVRQELGVERLGLTLVLPDRALQELSTSAERLLALQRVLDQNGLEVTGLHGVPVRMYDPKRRYGVFRPDWAEPERLEHTLSLTRMLRTLMPDDVDYGIVSTIPFFWRTRNDSDTRARAEVALRTLSRALADEANGSGRVVRVAMEPEPGCAVERSDEAADWLSAVVTRDGNDVDATPWLGLCLDTCHMSVQFEDQRGVLDNLPHLRPRVLKLQVANALQVANPPAELDFLEQFVDPGRLHQTRERRTGGLVYGVDDVSAAIPGGLPGDSEWRIHYHMPVYLSDRTSQPFTEEALRDVATSIASVRHFETETYTWPMLPSHLRPNGQHWIATGLARELDWTRQILTTLGFREDRS